MSNQKWNKGAPPSVGWWPASCFDNNQVIRWWNGKYWSTPAYPDWTAIEAADLARFKADSQADILWTERWWL
jgi:hypothetical protein